MKIVNFEEFNRMPAGTIFAPYEPCIAKDEPEIKFDQGHLCEYEGYGLSPTWCFNGTVPIVPRPDIDDDENFESSFKYGKVKGRFHFYDGCSADYCDEKMFLIYEKEDILSMMQLLAWSLDGCPDSFDDYAKNHTVNVTRLIHIPLPTPEEATAREKFLKDLKTSKDSVDYEALDKLIKKNSAK